MSGLRVSCGLKTAVWQGVCIEIELNPLEMLTMLRDKAFP